MDDHPRRLIDDRQPRVFVEDFERDILRAGRLPRDVRENRRHFLTDVKAVGRLSALAPYLDAARGNDPAEVYPAIAGEMMGQKDIQPPAGLFWGNAKLYRFRRRQVKVHDGRSAQGVA
jgi:hypothetical protein